MTETKRSGDPSGVKRIGGRTRKWKMGEAELLLTFLVCDFDRGIKHKTEKRDAVTREAEIIKRGQHGK